MDVFSVTPKHQNIMNNPIHDFIATDLNRKVEHPKPEDNEFVFGRVCAMDFSYSEDKEKLKSNIEVLAKAASILKSLKGRAISDVIYDSKVNLDEGPDYNPVGNVGTFRVILEPLTHTVSSNVS